MLLPGVNAYTHSDNYARKAQEKEQVQPVLASTTPKQQPVVSCEWGFSYSTYSSL